MPDPATPADESADRSDQGEDRPPQRSPGGAVNFPISLITDRHDRRARHRSYLAHPSNHVRGPRSGGGEQASVPSAGHQVRSEGTDVMRDWLEQEVINEIEGRRRNEWIEQANDSFEGHEATDDYACECSDANCTASIRLTRAEYEGVRREGTHFAIAVDHENPLIDRVVSETDQFAVVEKCFRLGRRMADESNPRG